MLVSQLRNKQRVIHLRNGKTIKRVVHTTDNYYNYVIYNGHHIGVEFGLGEWWQVAF